MPALSFQPFLFKTEIRIKITFSIHLDFDCLTHFFLGSVNHLDQMRGGEKVQAFCLEIRMAMDLECIGYSPVAQRVSISF